MKISCEIIGDLLPLYLDEACSEESKKAVEEHLHNCKKCAEDMCLMKSDIKVNSSQIQEEVIIKAAEKNWKKGKNNAFVKGCLMVLLCVLIIIGGYVSYHWFTTVSENNLNALAKQAADYFDYDELVIEKIEKRDNYLAALCKDKNGNTCMCEFEKDSLFKKRWFAAGGKSFIDAGNIGSWNYGSPQGEAVIIFCGSDIPDKVCYYKFQNSGITYTCPVEESSVLDIFIIQDTNDINGYPILLDSNGQKIK